MKQTNLHSYLYHQDKENMPEPSHDLDIVGKLNKVLAQEHACAIRYATHAAVIEGPYSEAVEARLKEISADEIRHAGILRQRIVALGGNPEMRIDLDDLKPAKALEDILRINIEEEKEAIRQYEAILKDVPLSNAILFEAIQDLIRDEQEHLEELEQLRPPTPL